MPEQEEQKPVAVREGSRWLYAKPTPEQVAEWWQEQPLHEGMEGQRDRYLGGIVVIGATEKIKVTRRKANGDPFVVEFEQAVFTPYVKVDTRIAYFRDLVRVVYNGGNPKGDYIGVIEPVEQTVISDTSNGYYNANLPKGMTVHIVRQSADRVSRYLVASWRCLILERQSYADRVRGGEAAPLLQGEGTKQVPAMRQYPDDNAVMKAETGAIGRALGVAGILVVGTGVASAEDVQEALSATPATQGAPEGAPAAVLPPAAPQAAAASADATAGTDAAPPSEAAAERTPDDDDRDLRTQAMKLREALEKASPEHWKRYVAWYNEERSFPPIAELKGTALKGAVQKLERDLAEAHAAQ